MPLFFSHCAKIINISYSISNKIIYIILGANNIHGVTWQKKKKNFLVLTSKKFQFHVKVNQNKFEENQFTCRCCTIALNVAASVAEPKMSSIFHGKLHENFCPKD